ncbi:pyridoxal phosphate-dependent transferase [Fomitopsis serialis]|uniref:pyridoxal phosphate-dependent transferase n=1 Tax=Fomitopsis serialis TaxID=139415 RepID=UPI0020079722|nr:pyridoxal phosphate-dependent transferase [Neoantrodia serialis]KAH9913765.1 pyridoxal phosphate-dependent transferase [Neoantrodia serialis]
MDIEAFRKAGYQAIDRICDFYYSLQDRPVVPPVQPGYLLKQLPDSPPEDGEDWNIIADDYQKLILPGLTFWQHPNFYAYFPTACTFEGCSATCTRPWTSSPACTELEMAMMDWCARLFGLADHFLNSSGTGGGVIQTTSSDSALVVTVAARSQYTRRHPDTKLEDLVLYVTSQTHSLGVKASLVLGLQCRVLDVKPEDEYALRGETLRAALEEDVARGSVLGTVGTTSSGAIDRLDEIGEVLKDYPDVWFHVDAAWAGVTLACPEYRDVSRLKDINTYATSVGTNLHKWGLVNFDAALLWVRSRKDLTDALDVTPEFLRTKQSEAGAVIDYRNWHLGLGRRFRSLKVWFVLRSYGVKGFQAYIRRCIDLNGYFASLVETSPSFALVTKPSFALTVFRVADPGARGLTPPLGADALNDLNRAFYARVSARGEIFLTQAQLNGTFCVRLAVGAERTRREHIDRAWALIQEEAGVAVEEWAGKIGNVGGEKQVG